MFPVLTNTCKAALALEEVFSYIFIFGPWEFKIYSYFIDEELIFILTEVKNVLCCLLSSFPALFLFTFMFIIFLFHFFLMVIHLWMEPVFYYQEECPWVGTTNAYASLECNPEDWDVSILYWDSEVWHQEVSQ